MFQIHPWPNAILHLDADAFFASVMQAVNPNLKGRAVIVGRERGIATAVSYEARGWGVKRGMRLNEIKRTCPHCLLIDSDYELYQLFSQKIFKLLREFSPAIEEYSIDEGFADLKGLRRPLRASYRQIGQEIKEKIEKSLGITVSVGISLTKSLAKLASSFQKPSGLTVVDGLGLEKFLSQIPLKKVWGIGEQTSAYLEKLGLISALDLALKPESFISAYLIKPHLEIWHELRGEQVYLLNTHPKTTYQSILKSETFRPATNEPHLLWARLLNNIEAAFTKARHYQYSVGQVSLFLKSQDFIYHTSQVRLLEKAAYPFLIRKELKKSFNGLLSRQTLYRTTGCCLSNLQDNRQSQLSFFPPSQAKLNKAVKFYPLYENKKIDFGTSLFDPQLGKRRKKQPRTRIPFLSLPA